MIIPKKSKPLTRPEVQAIQPDPWKDSMSYSRDKFGNVVSRFLVPQGKTMVVAIAELDSTGKPVGRPKREYDNQKRIYVVKQTRG